MYPYQEKVQEKIDGLKSSGNYREFVNLNRVAGQYPVANEDYS